MTWSPQVRDIKLNNNLLRSIHIGLPEEIRRDTFQVNNNCLSPEYILRIKDVTDSVKHFSYKDQYLPSLIKWHKFSSSQTVFSVTSSIDGMEYLWTFNGEKIAASLQNQAFFEKRKRGEIVCKMWHRDLPGLIYEFKVYVNVRIPRHEIKILDELKMALNYNKWFCQDGWGQIRSKHRTAGIFRGIKGVELDRRGRVVSLKLTDNNLSGYLPESIKYLSKLKSLDLSNNYIYGLAGVLPFVNNIENIDLSDNLISEFRVDLRNN